MVDKYRVIGTRKRREIDGEFFGRGAEKKSYVYIYIKILSGRKSFPPIVKTTARDRLSNFRNVNNAVLLRIGYLS